MTQQQQSNQTTTTTTHNPSGVDVLSRPRLPKKKQVNNNKKKSSAAGNKKNNLDQNSKSTSGSVPLVHQEDGNDHVDDDELIDQLLSQTAEMELVSSSPTPLPSPSTEKLSSSNNNNNNLRMSTTISRRIHDLGEDLKEVAHAVSPVTLINSKRKVNRQKDKIAKRQAAQLQAQLDAQLELDNNPRVDHRKLEADGIIQICKSLNLKVIDITPDGHCLYSAIADQLNLKDLTTTTTTNNNNHYDYKKCRKLASDYMRENRDEFIHYLPGQDDGLSEGLMTDLEYDEYCLQVANSARWGGEPEILALSKSLKFSIHIIQAFQPIIKICHDEFFQFRNQIALTISYHRKSYGLGEHYNSLRPIS